MVEVLKGEYWSKSEAFLVPLTGLTRTQKYPLKSFLFWNEYSIEDYFLILKFIYDDYEDFMKYSRRVIFPTLDKSGYLIESYDFEKETVFVLDISEWALDIEMFKAGKYSKMSKAAKELVNNYHTFYDKGPKILIEVAAALDPNARFPVLGNMTAIEYVAENYMLDLGMLKALGELGGIYNEKEETLVIKEKEV